VIVRQYGHFISLYCSFVVSRLYELLYVINKIFDFDDDDDDDDDNDADADADDGSVTDELVFFVYVVTNFDDIFLGNK
jgi:hypothetical protein